MRNRIELLSLVPKGGSVIEIGTLEGQFAKEMKQSRPDIQLTVVDNWEEPHERHEAVARKNLEGIAHIFKNHSVEAASMLPNENFDLVYIDADHTYAGCLSDIVAWWPKVKKGGVMALHDYENKPINTGWFTAIEVKDAVDKWIKSRNIELNVVNESAPSCWWRKP